MDLAKIGATPKGGVSRIALTDRDREGRDLLCTWLRSAGCTIGVDSIGNIFARRPRVRKSVQKLGYRHMNIVSGVGHDACYVARVAPTAREGSA